MYMLYDATCGYCAIDLDAVTTALGRNCESDTIEVLHHYRRGVLRARESRFAQKSKFGMTY
jgi:hypothetical protein